MDIPQGTVTVRVEGPPERLGDALAALHSAGITAKGVAYRTGAIDARFHDGSDWPTEEVEKACAERAGAVAAPLGFSVTQTAIWPMSLASIKDVVNIATGERLGSVNEDTSRVVQELFISRKARAAGLSRDQVELRDPIEPMEPTEPMTPGA
ncbi:hypothetical protein QMK19_09030 [Streptomyces sp. H10-C2]|uniref:hypothetical protein n=1 Tax=unclassified Streptomyces TaxID=2593676 RepID=UPI0024BB480D|nr:MULTISPECIES: hypothetical protein [unclassified Streptomyces]MDJ0340951.1 hypothetical protein [Streptomyces sp. PH10-H1]MDJ0369817.1 hypothetical protein [Streptomyces sp. H10-C2]